MEPAPRDIGRLLHQAAWLTVVLLSFSTAGCALSIPEQVGRGRLRDAWSAACERAGPTGDGLPMRPLPEPDRRALRAALVQRTRATIEARVLPRDELHTRLGEVLLPGDGVLLEMKVGATSFAGSDVVVDPSLALGKSRWEAWRGSGVWELTGISPPRAASIAGAPEVWLDAAVKVVTLGQLDPRLRGNKSWDSALTMTPGSKGTGTKSQQDVLRMLHLAGATPSRYGDSAPCGAALDKPCEVTVLLAPGQRRTRERRAVDLGSEGEGAPDALVVQVVTEPATDDHVPCDLAFDAVIPLPPGPTPAARLAELFARGPVVLGAAAAEAVP